MGAAFNLRPWLSQLPLRCNGLPGRPGCSPKLGDHLDAAPAQAWPGRIMIAKPVRSYAPVGQQNVITGDTAANLPGRPVDMWTIGLADRLRFPRFPSELGRRGNARLRPHYPQAPQPTKDLILMK